MTDLAATRGHVNTGRAIEGSEEETAMCWNCGCMIPDDDMGNPDNITTETIRAAAKAAGNRSVRAVMENMERTYKAMVRNTPVDSEPVV